MFKYKVLLIVVAAIALAIGVATWARRNSPPELVVAVAKARAGLRSFRDRVQHPRTGDKSFFVRGEFGEGDKHAYLWVKHVSAVAGGFNGTLDEEPFGLPGLVRGSQVTVKDEKVVDWTILHEDSTTEGNFTRGLEPH